MSEYIKREDAIKALHDEPVKYIKALCDVPSADVVEVGKWHKFGKDYVIECEMNEYGYGGFRIKKATDRDTIIRVFKDGYGERKDGESE